MARTSSIGMSFFLALLVWLPIPLASNRPWAVAILLVLLSVLFVIEYSKLIANNKTLFNRFDAVFFLIILFLCWQLLQIAPIEQFTGIELIGSIDRHATFQQLICSVVYLLAYCLCRYFGASRNGTRNIIIALVISGAIQAVWGLWEVFANQQIPLFGQQGNATVANGSFINRNHFAGYLVLCIACGTGLMLSQLGTKATAQDLREKVLSTVAVLLSNKVLLRLVLVLMVVALVLTRSRMGNIAFFSGLIIAGCFALFAVKQSKLGIGLFLVSVLIIDAIILGQWFGFDKVVERIEKTSLETEVRDDVGIDAWQVVRTGSWFGQGGGTFYTVFPSYQNTNTRGYFDHAHNDYIELASDYGAVMVLICIAVMGLSLWRAVVLQVQSPSRLHRGVGFAASMSIIWLAFHSSVDFNLYIPANAATFLIIMALLYNSRYRELSR